MRIRKNNENDDVMNQIGINKYETNNNHLNNDVDVDVDINHISDANPNQDLLNTDNSNNKAESTKKGKLLVYMKKTYNNCVSQILPFYVHTDNYNSNIMYAGRNFKNPTKNEGKEYFLNNEDKYNLDKNNTYWNDMKDSNNNCYSNILHCINSKIYIHEVNDNDFTKGAFLDNNFYISDIKIMKNFIIIADLFKGIFINMYNYEEQYDSRSIISISKNFYSNNLNILCCHYIIFNSFISIIAMDVYNNFIVFSYKNYQDIDNLYIFNYFNFNRRIVKFINALNKQDNSNIALSLSNDGSIHLFHPLNHKRFLFFKEIYNITKKYIFPNLAVNVHTHLKPDFFIQSIVLNLYKKTDSYLVKNILFDDLLR